MQKTEDENVDPVIEMACDAAFPTGPGYKPGLTIRDYFAAMALQGLVAAKHDTKHEQYDVETLTVAAVTYADELIAALIFSR